MRLRKTIFGRRILPSGQTISAKTYNEYLKTRKRLYDKIRYNLRKIAETRQENLAINKRYYEREYLGRLKNIPQITPTTTSKQIKQYIEKGKERLQLEISSTSGQKEKILQALEQHGKAFEPQAMGKYMPIFEMLLQQVEEFDVWNKWYFYDLAPAPIEFYKMDYARSEEIIRTLIEYVKKRNKPNRTKKK